MLWPYRRAQAPLFETCFHRLETQDNYLSCGFDFEGVRGIRATIHLTAEPRYSSLQGFDGFEYFC